MGEAAKNGDRSIGEAAYGLFKTSIIKEYLLILPCTRRSTSCEDLLFVIPMFNNILTVD